MESRFFKIDKPEKNLFDDIIDAPVKESSVAKTLRTRVVLQLEAAEIKSENSAEESFVRRKSNPICLQASFPLAFEFIKLGMIPHKGLEDPRNAHGNRGVAAMNMLRTCSEASDLKKEDEDNDRSWAELVRFIMADTIGIENVDAVSDQMLFANRKLILDSTEKLYDTFLTSLEEFLQNGSSEVVLHLSMSDKGKSAWIEAIKANKPFEFPTDWSHVPFTSGQRNQFLQLVNDHDFLRRFGSNVEKDSDPTTGCEVIAGRGWANFQR